MGIKPELLPEIFDRFRQGQRRTGGLGLGLAIVRHIVDLHGGTVRAQSAGDGRGANFTVELPIMSSRADAAERISPSHEGAVRSGAPALKGVKILVVDDDADARELLSMILEHAGAETATAGCVDEALAVLERFKPDVLVSDIGMPEHDGYCLIRKIRAGEGNGMSGIPAVALTAFARDEDRSQALESGFQAHLAKPIEPGELTAIIARLIT